MATKRALAQQLGVVAGFDDPKAPLEQYRTPPELAAHLIHLADLRGDLEGRTVVDLGCGTGMLALGAALRGPERVVGLDLDPDPLRTARDNERKVASSTSVSWVRGDAERAPLSTDPGETTVVMNPPFGAQSGNEHADRAFLATTADLAGVSYSIHNAGSREFVASFADDEGGEVTDSYAAEFELPRQFDHHSDESRTISAEVFRIEWDR
ncbi:METTL5 family protein [Halomicrobium salinisoli]|uniref:METTL5 family protein n=1 Tax=Halomicrobium salinisoli TaxID=2878391 RepID=UPI001CF0A225|nr:METTL5 family protein [Halomicrobium salinisoli]